MLLNSDGPIYIMAFHFTPPVNITENLQLQESIIVSIWVYSCNARVYVNICVYIRVSIYINKLCPLILEHFIGFIVFRRGGNI